jgi:DNA polymerase I-like protein with 3'-5' exonuclease and polymerase domains
MQVAWDLGKAMSIPLIYNGSVFNNSRNVKVYVEQMKRLLDNVKVCGHNYRYDESYIRVKLGLETKHFCFDTMLAHKFLWTHLPKSLDFLTSRWLLWPSHKRIIQAELDAMPKDIRSYGLLSQPVIFEYGCLDVDATLQVADILIKKLTERTYEEFSVDIIYDNAYIAYMERVMFPWRAFTNMEVSGALVDVDRLPVVASALKQDMDDAKSIIQSSNPYTNWLSLNTKPNPKRFKHKKKSFWNILCSTCSNESGWGWHDPTKRKPANPPDCPVCTSHSVVWKRRMKNTGEKVVVDDEPEFTTPELNLASPVQLQTFMYGHEYMSMPKHEKLGASTGKEARAYLKSYATQHNLGEHAAIIDAIGDYTSLSKLYTSYATKIGNYIWVHDNEPQTSDAVTSPYELPLPVNSLHAHMLQDGTHSGRLSSRDPSLHVIPSRGVRGSVIKEMFTSRFGDHGLILQADQSQAEVRAFCIETLDETLQDSFVRGEDPYIGVAAKVAGIRPDQVTPSQRQDTKSIVLGLLFGRGPSAIAEQTGKSFQEAVDLIQGVYAGAPKVQAWVGRAHDSVHKIGKVVTRFGRVRDLSDYIWSSDSGKVNHAENISQNHPIQGLVGDLVIDSVARMSYRMEQEGMKSVLFNTVHDSTIIDLYIPELFQIMNIAREELFTKLPEYFPFVNVPFEIDTDIGPSWGESIGIKCSGTQIITSGNPNTSDFVRKALARFFGMKMVSPPTFDPDSGKVGLTWDLSQLAA